MGYNAIYQRKNLSKLGAREYIRPYLLRGMQFTSPNQVWSTDITYIPMKKGFLYLSAIMDVFSRKILSWGISNILDAQWCVDVFNDAVERYGTPEIIKSDQGSQYTSLIWHNATIKHEVKISIDGKGRAIDNVFIERLWRSVKYEYAYLNPANGGIELYRGMDKYISFYNHERPHQKHDYKTPKELFFDQQNVA